MRGAWRGAAQRVEQGGPHSALLLSPPAPLPTHHLPPSCLLYPPPPAQTNGGVIYNQGGTVRDVTFDGMTVHATNQGAGVKLARPGRDATGGLVANASWLNLRVTAPRNAALYTNVFGEDAASCALPPKHDLPHWLTVTGALFRNVSAELSVAGQAAGCFLFTPGAPGSGFVFEGVQVTAAGGGSRAAAPYACYNTRGFSAQGDTAPAPCP